MPHFRIWITAEQSSPFPPLDTLPEVETESALDAIHKFLKAPRVERKPMPQWARAVLTVHETGRHVLRVPIHVHEIIPLKWTVGKQ